ncbi:MAG: DegV family protein [Lachnospiraceae bacterium]
MRTAIVTDTNSGITIEAGRQSGIYVLPMPVIIEEKCYYEGIDITNRQLYDAMGMDKELSSSQPSPGDVMDMWEQIFTDGYEEIVYIPMSSGLSGSCHSAAQLALEYDQKVQVVDNHRISVTLMESVFDAKALADQGKSAKEIKEYLEENAYRSSIYVTVDSLKYLKKGGRITPRAAAIANILNIKPVLTIQGEKLDLFAKVRGNKQSQKKMIEALKADIVTRFGDVPPERLRIGTAGTFEQEEDAKEWSQMVQSAFPDSKVYYCPLPCSIACHVGINASGLGVSVITERDIEFSFK